MLNFETSYIRKCYNMIVSNYTDYNLIHMRRSYLDVIKYINNSIYNIKRLSRYDKHKVNVFKYAQETENIHCVDIMPYFIRNGKKYFILREEIGYNKYRNNKKIYSHKLGSFGGKREMINDRKELVFLTGLRELYEESAGIIKIHVDKILESKYIKLDLYGNKKKYEGLVYFVEVPDLDYDLYFHRLFTSNLFKFIRTHIDDPHLKSLKLYSYYCTNSIKIMEENDVKKLCKNDCTYVLNKIIDLF